MPDVNLGTETTTTTLTNTIKSYYDRMLLETLDPQTRFYQFGVKKPLPTGEGTSVIWNRPRRLGFGQKITTAGQKPSANALSTTKVSALIEKYGGYIVIDDTVSLTSITDVLDMGTRELAKQAAETLDRAIVHSILFFDDPGTATSAVHIGKTSANLIISTDAIPAATYATALMAVSDIRVAATELRRRNANPWDGTNYMGIIHPVVAEDLRADSTWQNWHQYTNPENLYNGETTEP